MASSMTATTWIGCKLGDAAAISGQTRKIADLFAAFVAGAQSTLHIAIYDFRLDESAGAIVMGALNEAADRGVDVRVAYYEQPPRKNVRADGGDPSPGTRRSDLAALKSKVKIKAIKAVDVSSLPAKVKREPIEGGRQLMHSKYMIRDGEAVWTGSANFTTDAWSIQDNNVVVLQSPEMAGCYGRDFDELWENGRLAGTGKNDLCSATVDGEELDVAFCPGEGSTVEKEVAGALQGARESVAIASMVISSGAILGALVDAMKRGVKVTGVYDGSEMRMVARDWGKSEKSAGKAQQWKLISSKLIAKQSVPYKPDEPHNFMHTKVAVVDGKLMVTGSFNFSDNATRNAENLLTIRDPDVVEQYETYVADLVSAYRKQSAGAPQKRVRKRARSR